MLTKGSFSERQNRNWLLRVSQYPSNVIPDEMRFQCRRYVGMNSEVVTCPHDSSFSVPVSLIIDRAFTPPASKSLREINGEFPRAIYNVGSQHLTNLGRDRELFDCYFLPSFPSFRPNLSADACSSANRRAV